MYICRYEKKTKNKIYTSAYIAKSYRDENGKVQREHISNISHMSKPEIDSLEIGLRSASKKGIFISPKNLEIIPDKSIGAIHVIKKMADRLKITNAVGKTEEKAKLVLLMIMARIIFPGSKCSNVRWSKTQEIEKIIGLNTSELDENDLYNALDWLSENQKKIEKKLFKNRYKNNEVPKIYLYDVTSSYLEGTENELGFFGYNRDKKKGKKQIVIGLMTDEDGMPISVRVFKGNTSDTRTVPEQIKTLAKEFNVKEVTFVGDKGMIRGPQIELLHEENFNYITTITRDEIRTLIKQKKLQYDFFDITVAEFFDEEESIRYIYRRNPLRTKEIQSNRNEKIENIISFATERTNYLKDGKKRSAEIALKHVQSKINKFKLSSFLNPTIENRIITVELDNEKKATLEKLDGCYVVKTDLSSKDAETKEVHDRYKDLYNVEYAFRTVKSELEIRPLYLRNAERTKAHVFICMLAYMINLEFKRCTKELDGTSQDMWYKLDHLMTQTVNFGDVKLKKCATPNDEMNAIFSALNIKSPKIDEVQMKV